MRDDDLLEPDVPPEGEERVDAIDELEPERDAPGRGADESFGVTAPD